uniref:Uncharacterized protein n=1 Tax=Anguilla anguilla TaxID=7936 RepID=A0A0E9X0V5_ANGAN
MPVVLNLSPGGPPCMPVPVPTTTAISESQQAAHFSQLRGTIYPLNPHNVRNRYAWHEE